MREIDQGGRAFPWCGDLHEMPSINLGMTLRDYLAAKAMQGMCAHPNTWGLVVDEIAKQAYLLADAMLKARSQS